jgi:hypothetical protein
MSVAPKFQKAAVSRLDAMQAAGVGAGAKPSIPAERAVALDAARQALAPTLAERDTPAYPVTALGPLRAACEAISEHAQVQPAMAGQCLLGAASLLTQGLFNVQTMAGTKPLSAYAMTLGDSGEGKSTAQGAALQPVTAWQRQQARRYAEDLREFDKAKGRRKNGDDPPEEPPSPYRLCSDSTVEGLRRDLNTGPCSQGVFTDEAAAILAGYGMSPDHRAKTAGVFSKLWDAGHLSVSRSGAPRVERYGVRVALHWLIQPAAAAESIGDPLLSDLGFWPRFLAAWPAPQPPRLARPFHADRHPAIGAYWQRCSELLAEPLPEDAGDCPALPLAADAQALLHAAFERFDREARCGDLRPIKPFALRASEQACRVAGVLAAFAGQHAVQADTMQSSLALVAYSLSTWQALLEGGAADQQGAHAWKLYQWLTDKPDWTAPLATIVNAGPACVRTKDKRDTALLALEAAGLVSVGNGCATALLAPALTRAAA